VEKGVSDSGRFRSRPKRMSVTDVTHRPEGVAAAPCDSWTASPFDLREPFGRLRTSLRDVLRKVGC
jgi:hypothetical protein